ncbi:MAG: twin-arginine translocation pathway signal protein [Smithellaceae bacterium]
MQYIRIKLLLCALLSFVIICSVPMTASAESAGKINRDAQKALQKLYAESESAKDLGEKAKAILVFPAITKGGFIVGGLYGEGALLKSGNVAAYYNTIAVSYVLLGGLQHSVYVLLFMTDWEVKYLYKSDGWEFGTGPTIVVVDKGASASLSTTTAKSDVYAFFFSQKGLMAGLGLQGTKITKINK